MDCLCFAGVWKMQSEFRCRAQHMVGIEQAYEVRYVQVQRVLRPMFVKVKLEDWCPACSACQDLEPSCNITFSDGRPPYVCFARTGDGDIIRRFPVVASIGYYLVGFYFILSGIQLICSALGTCPLVASTVLAFLAAFAGGTGVICNLAPQRSTYLYIALGVILTHCLFLIVLIFMFEGHSIKLGWIDWYNLLAFALNTFGLKGPEVLAGFFEVDLLCCVPWLPRCFNQYGPQGWVPLDRAIFAQPFDRVGEMRSRQAAIPFIHDSDAEISDHKVLPVVEDMSQSSELNCRGWRLLCEEEPLKAIDEFSKAIDLDKSCAEAFNNRGIAKEIAGQNEAAQQDYEKADSLAAEGKCSKRSLELNRKWKPIGWQARGEPEAKCKAEEADFLLSFANPDAAKNNQILTLLQQGVWFGDQWGPASFCHDRSLGTGVHVVGGEAQGRQDPRFTDLDVEKEVGEFPRWFEHYKQAAEATRHGILILQLTSDYFKSKACRWEFGYLRRPQLVHVFVMSAQGPWIVTWQQLAANVGLCRQIFGGLEKLDVPTATEQELQQRFRQFASKSHDVSSMVAVYRVTEAANLVGAQEHQSWCELPLWEVAYALAISGPGQESLHGMASAERLMTLCVATGQSQRALVLGSHLLEIVQRKFGPDDPVVAGMLNNVATAYGNIGNQQEKTKLLEKALAIVKKRFGPESLKNVSILSNLADAYAALGDFDRKKQLGTTVLGIVKEHYGPEDVEVGHALFLLGSALWQLGELTEARKHLEEVLKIREKSLGAEHPEVADTMNNLGGVYLGSKEAGDHQRAKDLLERALKIKMMHLGPNHLELAKVLTNLGHAHTRLGDPGKATGRLTHALRIKELHYGQEHVELAAPLVNLGLAYRDVGFHEQQRDVLQRALTIEEQHFGREHWKLGSTLGYLANAHSALGSHRSQQILLQRQLNIEEQRYGQDHQEVATTLVNLSTAHSKLGELTLAKKLLERALPTLARNEGVDPSALELARTNRASLNRLQVAASAEGSRMLKEAREHFGSELGDSAALADLACDPGEIHLQVVLQEHVLEIEANRHGEVEMVADRLRSLSRLYVHVGERQKRKEGLQRALQIEERRKSPEFRKLAETVRMLADPRLLDNHGQQMMLWARALDILEKNFGADDAEAADLRANMRRLHHNMLLQATRYKAALEAFSDVVDRDQSSTSLARAKIEEAEDVLRVPVGSAWFKQGKKARGVSSPQSLDHNILNPTSLSHGRLVEHFENNQEPLPPSLESSRTSDVGCERHMDRPLPPVRRVEALFADAVGHDARLGRGCWIRILEAVGCTSETAAAVFELAQRSVEQPHLCARDIFRFLWGHEACSQAEDRGLTAELQEVSEVHENAELLCTEESAEAQEAAERNGQCQAKADVEVLSSRGWSKLEEGRHEDALADFSRAIELDPELAAAYNHRGITLQILGRDAEEDFAMADGLTMHDTAAYEALQLIRKWKPIGFKARGEAEGKRKATEADFLISFASPDSSENNKILHLVTQGVQFQGQFRSVSFCHDRSLGMGVQVVEGQNAGRWDQQFSDLDQVRKPGEYPRWFVHYKRAAEETKHGILILQLTNDYFKSKACRWEFGYVRKPELVHVFVHGADGPQILRWQELMARPALCKQAFGGTSDDRAQLNQVAENMANDEEVKAMEDLLAQVGKAADFVEAQEHQAWCELPLREMSYALATESLGEESEPALNAANRLMACLIDTGHAERAVGMGTRLLEIEERHYGADHPRAATARNNLGNAYGKLGDYQRKKELLEQCLKINEQHYGPDHLHLAKIRCNLGNAYGDLGDYQRQKELLEQGLKILQQCYGPDHPEVATTLNNLGCAYGNLGDDRHGMELLERCLKIKEQHYGADHPEVATMLSNLATAYRRLGDYQRAMELLEQCVRIEEQHYGADHPEVAKILANLGTVYGQLGDYQRGKELLEQGLKILQQCYGPDHPEVATPLHNLGNAYGQLGDHRRMKELLGQGLKIKEKHYGPDHPEVAITLNSLGNAYGELGDYQRKKELLEQGLRIVEQQYGPDHPEVARTLGNLGNAYGKLGDYQRQKELLEHCRKIFEQYYGPDHPEVATILSNLGRAYGGLGDYQWQKELVEQGLKILEQHYGPDHPEVATILANLGNAYGELGDYQRKKELLEQGLKIEEQHYGADHPEVAKILANLGTAYGQLGDYQRAKELLERSLEIFQRLLGPGHPHVDLVRHNLGKVCPQLESSRTAKDCGHPRDPAATRLEGARQTTCLSRNEAAAAEAISQLPREPFSTGKGFTWLDALRSVACDAQAKEATCVFPQMGTIFTHQVLTREDACDFVLQVVDAGGEGEEPIYVGVVSDEPVGFGCLPVGHPQLANSIGIVSAGPHAGHIVHAGQSRREVQGIASGDTIRIQIEPGSNVTIWHGPTVLVSFAVGGDGMFRCAASLSSIGQRVRIMDSAQDASAAAAVSRMVDPRRAGQTSPSNPAVPVVRDEQKKAEEQDGSPCSPAKVAAAEDKGLDDDDDLKEAIRLSLQ
ncbi:NPHP3, partial [Symbiodinium microadriaticum]